MKDAKMRRNKQYTKEFRDSTVQLALNSEEPIKKIAEDLDTKYHTLYDWIKAHKRANKKSNKA
jgi:transposase